MKFSSFWVIFLSSTSKRQNLMVNWTSRGDATGKKSDQKKRGLVYDFKKKIEKANFDIPKRPPWGPFFQGRLFSDFCQKSWRAHHHWVLVSNMCYFHPFLGFHDPIWLAHMFQTGGEKSQDTSGRRWRLRTGGRCYPNFQPKKGLLSRQKEVPPLEGNWGAWENAKCQKKLGSLRFGGSKA